MKNKLDILLTAYNNPSFLDDCLNSLLKQTISDFNIYLVDDCSKDNMELVVTKFINLGLNITFIKNKKNKGALLSLNEMYKISTSPFILCLHHDDILEPDFIELVLFKGLMCHPECSLGYSLFSRLIDNNSTCDTGQLIPKLKTGVHDIVDFLCVTSWLIPSFVIFRRNSFDSVGAFDRHIEKIITDVYHSGSVDHYMYARLAAVGKAYVLNEHKGFYRIHNDQNTKTEAKGKTHISQSCTLAYDYIYNDHDLFNQVTRLIARANQVGRILANIGPIEYGISMVQSEFLGDEISDIKYEFLSRLHYVFSLTVHDDIYVQENKLPLYSEDSLDITLEYIGSINPINKDLLRALDYTISSLKNSDFDEGNREILVFIDLIENKMPDLSIKKQLLIKTLLGDALNYLYSKDYEILATTLEQMIPALTPMSGLSPKFRTEF